MLHELNNGIRQLHQKVDGQTELLERLTELRAILENEEFFRTVQATRRRERELTRAILAAITVLEESRKSFRSKQLEQLRRHLVQALAGDQ
jgi:CBS-domain-containing membrane protein